MMKLYFNCLILAGFFCSAFVSPALAASNAATDRSSLPITVKSNEMSADNKGKTAVFVGRVVAKQADITIFSDKLIVNYSDQKGDVDKVEAQGNVRIIQLNRTGFADQAVYESRSGRIVLTGSPRVVSGGDSISGKIITYFVDDEKSEVSSGGDPKARVEAVINQPTRKKNVGNP
ncbi:MAG: lipopolysaccharide transport periplasmic protein LptA [Desulfuromonadaceae bacterium]|nr:lipopolysaccharide transport periplasmic protein LptA [Desulfuromonadaceae bacterium]MDD2856150.1 lipopolysaccharide transport periplasmic protein LptA [Desulfuromonadaceae bacterium]